MTWRIPPVGFCAICLALDGDERAAVTLHLGTSLCREHLESEHHAECIAPLDQIEEG